MAPEGETESESETETDPEPETEAAAETETDLASSSRRPVARGWTGGCGRGAGARR